MLSLHFGCETLDGGTIPDCVDRGRIDVNGGTDRGSPPMTCELDNVDEGAPRVVFTLDLANTFFDTGPNRGLTIGPVEVTLGPMVNGERRGVPTGTCMITIHDDETFTAACGAAAPSVDQPCQLTVVLSNTIFEDNTGFVSVRCVDVHSDTSDRRISVAGVGSSTPAPRPFMSRDPPNAGEFWTCPITRHW